MKTSVKTLQEAAEVLAGKTGYNVVEYRGIEFRRVVACTSEFARNGDISVAGAKKYIRDYLREELEIQRETLLAWD
jgi:hypothetical protein